MSSRSPPLEAQRFGRSQTPESPRPIAIPEPSNIPVLQNQMDPVFNDTATYDIRPDSQPSTTFKNPSSESGEMHYEDLNAKSQALQQSLLNDQAEAQRVQNHAAPTNDAKNTQISMPKQTEQLLSSAPADHAIAQHNNHVDQSQEHISSTGENPSQPGLSLAQNRENQGQNASGDHNGIDYESILASIAAPTSDNVPIAKPSAPEDAHVSSAVEKPLPAAIGLPPKPPLPEKPTNFAQYNMPDSFNSSYYPNTSVTTTAIDDVDTSPVKASPAPNGLAPPPSLPSQHTSGFAAQSSIEPQTQTSQLYLPQPSDTERPWGPEIQQIYDKFLEDERMYVTEGVWDKFPLGSRLFVGNLPTEKVTKRDLFHIFHKYGQLAQISIKQAYGFVQFLQAADCQAALQAEQGVELRERLLHLEISKPQRNTRNANQGGNRTIQRRRSRSPDRAVSRMNPDHGNYSSRPPYSDYRDEPVRRRDDYRPVRSPSPKGYRNRDEFRGRDDRYGGSPQLGSNGFPGAGSPALDDDAMLPLPRRAPRDVPDVQLLVLEDVGHQLVNFVEQGFRAKGLTAQTTWLNPRLALAAVIKRQIIEGVQAVVKLTRGVQYNSKIPLQVFDRSPGTTNVNFNEYVDLDVPIAADIVIQARQKERMAAQKPAPSPYPQQIFQPPLPPPQYQQTPVQQHYGQQPMHQYQAPRPQSQQYHPPNPNQYGTSQHSPQTPNSGGSNLQELLANLNRQPPGNPSQPQQQTTPTQQAGPDLAGLLQNVAARQQNQSNGIYGQAQGYVPPQPQQPHYGQYQTPPQNQPYGTLQQPQQNVQNVMDQLARYNRR